MKKLIIVLLFSCLFSFDLFQPVKSKVSEVKKDLVYSFITEVVHLKAFSQLGKVTNGDHWLNIGVRGTVNLSDTMDLKFGISEYFDGLRGSSYFNKNHKTLRVDLGLFIKFGKNFSVGFVSSQRMPIFGYTHTSLDNEFNDTKEWIEARWTL